MLIMNNYQLKRLAALVPLAREDRLDDKQKNFVISLSKQPPGNDLTRAQNKFLNGLSSRYRV